MTGKKALLGHIQQYDLVVEDEFLAFRSYGSRTLMLGLNKHEAAYLRTLLDKFLKENE
jgi:hypothetical protein